MKILIDPTIVNSAKKALKNIDDHPQNLQETFYDIVVKDCYYGTIRSKFLFMDDIRIQARAQYPNLTGKDFKIVDNPFIEKQKAL